MDGNVPGSVVAYWAQHILGSHSPPLPKREMIVSRFLMERLRLEHSVLPPCQLDVFCYLYCPIKLIQGLSFVSLFAINGLPVW